MPKKKIYFAIDLGASSGRTIAGEFDGRRLSIEEVHRFMNNPVNVESGIYWDILYLFFEIKKSISMATSKYKSNLISLGVDTWGVDYGLIDRNGKLIGNPYCYRDSRTKSMERLACQKIPREKIYAKTGIHFIFLNTLNQLLAEKQTESIAINLADKILFIPDLINYWLTGIKINEYSVASTSQMINPWTKDWDISIINAMGFPESIFGEIVQPATSLGKLLPNIADTTNSNNLQVITVASHDTASAVVSIPKNKNHSAFLSSGTWSLMGIKNKTPIINNQSYSLNFTNYGGFKDSILFLKNICGMWLIEECRRKWSLEDQSMDYKSMMQMIEDSKSSDVYIFPDHPSFILPGNMPEKILAFFRKTGQNLTQDKGTLLRAILESLALRYKSVFNHLEMLCGDQLEVLNIIGGGSQNHVLNQFTANAINRPVIAGPIEATTIGNVIVQMLAQKEIYTLEEGNEIIRDSFKTITYTPENIDVWKEAYYRYQRLENVI